MEITLELNKKFKTGYQIHVTSSAEDGDVTDFDDVYDVSPYPLWKAKMMAVKALDLYNKRFETDYQLKEVLKTTMEGIRVNSRVDLDSARAFEMVKESFRNADGAETYEDVLDEFDAAKKEAVEYLEATFEEWNDSLDEEAESELKRLCEYLYQHGVKTKPNKLFHQLSGMPVDDACEWIAESAMDVFDKTHNVDAMMSYIIQ